MPFFFILVHAKFKKMIELVVILLIMFAIGAFINATKYHSKEKRKVGISRKKLFRLLQRL